MRYVELPGGDVFINLEQVQSIKIDGDKAKVYFNDGYRPVEGAENVKAIVNALKVTGAVIDSRTIELLIGGEKE